MTFFQHRYLNRSPASSIATQLLFSLSGKYKVLLTAHDPVANRLAKLRRLAENHPELDIEAVLRSELDLASRLGEGRQLCCVAQWGDFIINISELYIQLFSEVDIHDEELIEIKKLISEATRGG